MLDLNFQSNHPTTQKIGVIYGLIDKVIKLSNSKYHQTNIENVIKILLKNGYPLTFIFKHINHRIKHLTQVTKNNTKNNGKPKREGYLVTPHIKSIATNLKHIGKKYNLNIIHSCKNKLSKFITTEKDHINKMKQNNVVYKIKCKDCDANYVGQTKRQLQTRIKEHRTDINKKSGLPSVISTHRLSQKHDFDWDNVKILDKEPSYKKRLTSEMIHIKIQHNNINKQTDTDAFPDTYLHIIKNSHR